MALRKVISLTSHAPYSAGIAPSVAVYNVCPSSKERNRQRSLKVELISSSPVGDASGGRKPAVADPSRKQSGSNSQPCMSENISVFGCAIRDYGGISRRVDPRVWM